MERFNLRIIKAVKKCPNLYKNNVSKELRKEEWQKLASRYNLNEVQIRRRWLAMCESFKCSLNSPSSPEFPYKNEMEFLLPYVQSSINVMQKKEPPELEFNITKEDLESMDDYDDCAFQELDDITPISLKEYQAKNCIKLIPPVNQNQKMAKKLQEQKESPKDKPCIAVRMTGQLMPKKIILKKMEDVSVGTEYVAPVVSNEEVKKPTPNKNNLYTIIPINTIKRLKINTEQNERIHAVQVPIKENESNIPVTRSKVLVPITKPDKCANVKPKIAAKVVLEKAEPLPKSTNNLTAKKDKKLTTIKEANLNTEDGVRTKANFGVTDNKQNNLNTEDGVRTKAKSAVANNKQNNLNTEVGVRTKINSAVANNKQNNLNTEDGVHQKVYSAVADNNQKAKPIPDTSGIVQTIKKERSIRKFAIINKSCYTSTRTSLQHLKKSAQKRNQYRMFGNFIGDSICQMPKEKRIKTMNQMINVLYA